MKRLALLSASLLALPASVAVAEDWLDTVDQALTFTSPDENFRLRFSGQIDLEFYHASAPVFGLVDTTSKDLFNPRLILFADAQLGPAVYAFVQARVDRGFDPSDADAQVRLDEFAIRYTPWEDGRFNLQAGRFATIVGSWVTRHLAWDNPFVTAPLLYEHLTPISDIEAPADTAEFAHELDPAEAYEYNPVVWGPVYATGLSTSGRVGNFEYAAEVKNAPLTSRPEAWDATDDGFDHPSFGLRVGYRPTMAWNLGLSASRGPYLRPDVEPHLPHGFRFRDYQQTLLAQDISYASGHLQLWAEFHQVRFEVPGVGEADSFAYFIEAKYKFRPELFGALRWNQQWFGQVRDDFGGQVRWGADTWRLDAALGYRFTPHTQLKVQYSFEDEQSARGQNHAIATQFTLRF